MTRLATGLGGTICDLRDLCIRHDGPTPNQASGSSIKFGRAPPPNGSLAY